MTRRPGSIEEPPKREPLSEDQLAAVTIGEREPLDGPIQLQAYDPAWASRFEEMQGRIRASLGVEALMIEHVGSTAVPGLSAKPIIDMVLAVADSADEAAYVPALEDAGFVLRIREPDWFEHRMLISPGIAGHLHVFSRECAEIGRMLAFRDRLRASAEDRTLYEDTKRELAARIWKHMQSYADAKSEVIGVILDRALRKR